MRRVAFLAALSAGLASPIQAQDLHARPAHVVTILPAGTSRLTGNAYAYRPKQLADPPPLILLLHGAGGDASRVLNRYIPVAEQQGAILVAQQSTDVSWRIRASSNGRVDFGPDVEKIDQALAQLFAQVSVDPRRTVVIGFSDGASYALSVGLANPQLFRCIVALSPGYLAIPSRVDRSQRIFITHGRRDEILPFSNVIGSIVPDLEKVGLRPRVRCSMGVTRSMTRC